eukprot:1380177-Prymnesium_polylepis.1
MCHCCAGLPGFEKTTPEKLGHASSPSTAFTKPSQGTDAAAEPSAPQTGARSTSLVGTSKRPGDRCTSST